MCSVARPPKSRRQPTWETAYETAASSPAIQSLAELGASVTAVKYWNGTDYSATCPATGDLGSQLLTVRVTDGDRDADRPGRGADTMSPPSSVSRRDQRGFTLVELLAALAIIATVMVPITAWGLLSMRQQSDFRTVRRRRPRPVFFGPI